MDPSAILKTAGLSAPEPVPLSGGDVSRVYRAGPFVVKTHEDPPPGLFWAEAEGLKALAEAGVRVPRVHWVGEGGIVLEYLPPGPDDWKGLARMLARLHRTRGTRYGGPRPGYLGTFPLPAGEGEDWSRFFTEKRLLPLIQATWTQLGTLGPELESLLPRLRLPTEGPTLIHGDLWSGNVHMSEAGPALLDPSVWVGERGVDLAMMRLFGGFPELFWQEYGALYPVPPEVRDALPCYQLYYLLVHVLFFGSGYLGSVRRALAACS